MYAGLLVYTEANIFKIQPEAYEQFFASVHFNNLQFKLIYHEKVITMCLNRF